MVVVCSGVVDTVVTINAKLVAVTQPVIGTPVSNAEGLIAYCARVSNPSNQDNPDYKGLLNYCIKNKHWSVFEMSNAVVEVSAPRDITRQLLRHRSFSFQEFCVAGDTKITLDKNSGSCKVTIEALYKRFNSPYWKKSQNYARIYDQTSGNLSRAEIKEVFKTGVKPTYEVTLSDGKSLVATPDHKILTKNGFVRVGELSVGDFVATDGVPVYSSLEWLSAAKQRSIANGTGLQGIAAEAGVSSHTIRKWLKKLKLSFTKKEVALYTEIWNKGLPKHLQPRYGKVWTQEQRTHHRKITRKGKESNLFSTGGNMNRTWRSQVADFCYTYKNQLLVEQNYRCAISGVDLLDKPCEVDHIKPVWSHPELAFEVSNLQVLSPSVHRTKTYQENLRRKKTVGWKPIISITFAGEVQTYDMEIEHTDHNYVANGIVTHNSQRYSDEIEFTDREFRRQDDKNRQNSTDDLPEETKREVGIVSKGLPVIIQDMYRRLREADVAKECARVFLPEGLTMSKLYVNGTIRSWLHYLDVRDDPGVTQWEHVLLAREIRKALGPAFPTIFNLKG